MKCLHCGNCGGNHFVRNCPLPYGVCHFCKKGVHKKNECPYYIWHLFTSTYPVVLSHWTKILEGLIPQFVTDDELKKKIQERKYLNVDTNFLMNTVRLYKDVVESNNYNFELYTDVLNRIEFAKQCFQQC